MAGGFQFAYALAGANSNVPVAGTFPMSGATYNDGDLLTMDTTTGLLGTVAQGDPGTVAAVFAGTRTGGSSGQQGTVYIIDPSHVWKCSTNASTYAPNLGAGSVGVLNAGTVNSVPGTNTSCVLVNKGNLDGNGNVIAYVRFKTTSF